MKWSGSNLLLALAALAAFYFAISWVVHTPADETWFCSWEWSDGAPGGYGSRERMHQVENAETNYSHHHYISHVRCEENMTGGDYPARLPSEVTY